METKPPLSYDGQLELLRKRGLVVDNEDFALSVLKHTNYYRLVEYRKLLVGGDKDSFLSGTSFEELYAVYIMDKELRVLLIEAMKHIEISTRSIWAYTLSHKYTHNFYWDQKLYKSQKNYFVSMVKLHENITKSSERFITKYQSANDIPAWVICEIMTFGQISMLISNLKEKQDKQNLAALYDMNSKHYVSLIHHLVVLRNYCAHHSMLWARDFDKHKFTIPTSRPSAVVDSFNLAEPHKYKLYNSVLMIIYLLNIILGEKNDVYVKFCKFFDSLPMNILQVMGFREDWKKLKIFNK